MHARTNGRWWLRSRWRRRVWGCWRAWRWPTGPCRRGGPPRRCGGRCCSSSSRGARRAAARAGWSASARGGPTGTAPGAGPALARRGCRAGAAAGPGQAAGRPCESGLLLPRRSSHGRASDDRLCSRSAAVGLDFAAGDRQICNILEQIRELMEYSTSKLIYGDFCLSLAADER